MIFGAATVPAPQPTSTPVSPAKTDLTHIVGPVPHRFWGGATSSLWTFATLAVLVALVAIRAVHAFAHPRRVRDEVRRFPGEVSRDRAPSGRTVRIPSE
ncbi:MAG: hypothetical protein JO147_04360 [Actinobacteria bacterium]|nr:hypothetical protein [Actinomycetota bacterium]